MKRRTSTSAAMIYFLGGLMGFLVIFFFVCFYLGKVINYWLREAGWRARPLASLRRNAQRSNART